jgi:hypothetical protein
MHGTFVSGALALAVALVGPGAVPDRAPAPHRQDWQIRITGPAVLDRSGSWGEVGTTVLIPALVRCPAGEHGFGQFAGFPGYFPDGDHAEPTLPAHTAPTPLVTCTGHPQRVTFVGRSVHRNQDPAVEPYEHFHRGRATVVLELLRMDGTAVRTSRTVRILAPRG